MLLEYYPQEHFPRVMQDAIMEVHRRTRAPQAQAAIRVWELKSRAAEKAIEQSGGIDGEQWLARLEQRGGVA